MDKIILKGKEVAFRVLVQPLPPPPVLHTLATDVWEISFLDSLAWEHNILKANRGQFLPDNLGWVLEGTGRKWPDFAGQIKLQARAAGILFS